MSTLDFLHKKPIEKSKEKSSDKLVEKFEENFKEIKKESKGFSLNLGVKNETISQDISPKTNRKEDPKTSVVDPFASLANALTSIDNPISSATEIPPQSNSNTQFKNPTLSDVEKFVFDKQPDSSTEEITAIFSNMIDELAEATGDQVPLNVARSLEFIKENAFLADILRPEAINVLVTGLRRSYGFIVKAKTANSAKKAKTNKKVSVVLDSLADLKF